MQDLSSKCDIVLFLGAGFSVSAGLPVMSDFGSGAMRDYRGLQKHVTNAQSADYRYAAPMLVEAGRVFQEFQKFCMQSNTISENDRENLETIFCIAEALREAGIEHVKLDGHLYSIGTLIENIQLWIWMVFQQCPLLNKERKDKVEPEVYEHFFGCIKELKLAENLTVVSTNYDLIYEYLSKKNGIPCVYPVKNAKCIKAGHGHDQYISLEGQDSREGRTQTTVCKLHGSINYFHDKAQEKEGSLLVATDLGDEKAIGNSGSWKNLPAMFAVDSIWKIRSQYGNRLTPVIIPPTYAKLRQQQWLGEIWNRAFHAIKQARKIVFIGYSMPSSDGFMRALIHGAMAERKHREPPKVYVIDESDKVHRRYEELFKSSYEAIRPRKQTLKEVTEDGTLTEILQ